MASGQHEHYERARQGAGLLGAAVDLAVHQTRRLPQLALRLPALGAGFALVAAETLRQQARTQGTGVGIMLHPDAVVAALKAAFDTVRPLADDFEVNEEAQQIAERARAASERTAATSQAARDVGAPGAATPLVDKAVDEVGALEVPDRTELPISDFDNATLASLRARLRALTIEQLLQLREYEQAHAHRLPVITLLENRIAKLEADAAPAAAAPGGSPAGTEPAPGDSGAEHAAEQTAAELGGTVRP